MKAFITVIVLVGLVIFSGCKEKTEPVSAPKINVDLNQTAAAVKDTAAQTQTKAETAVAEATEQTTCPVMGNPIDKTLFVEYKGKKVYFCCKGCIAEFNKDPEKYLSKLPQFKQ